MPASQPYTADTDVIGKVKEALVQRIGQQRFELWFDNVVAFRVEATQVVVEVEGDFAMQRLRANYFRHIESAVAQAMGKLVPVRMQLAETAATCILTLQVGKTSENPVKTADPAGPRQPASGLRRLGAIATTAIDGPPRRRDTDADSKPGRSRAADPSSPSLAVCTSELMTFANFAPGDSNQLAHTAAQLLADQPQQSGPLCFWGATGTGKTHLLNAIRQELRSRHRMQRVILLSAEDFTNDFLIAVRGTGLPAFRKRYRDVDALLIDNIQFFGGKSATLREVLYTIDTISSRRRPLVLAGDRPPTEIEGLSSELAGRMSGGLVCGLNPHGIELRRELLRRESLKSFLPWDDATIDQLAMRVSGDGRLIQGIGRLVSMLQRMYRRMPTMDEIVREAGDMLQRGPRSVALADIERAVCAAFGLPVGELRSGAKTRTVSQPRILAMFLARQHTPCAYSEIGRYFGDRNHSTVIAAKRRAEGWLVSNQTVGGRGSHGIKIREAIEAVENLLRIG